MQIAIIVNGWKPTTPKHLRVLSRIWGQLVSEAGCDSITRLLMEAAKAAVDRADSDGAETASGDSLGLAVSVLWWTLKLR